MTKVTIDVKNAVLESVIAFRGQKQMKNTFTGSAKVNKEDIIAINVDTDDDEEEKAAKAFLEGQINEFVDKVGKKVSQLQIKIHSDQDKELPEKTKVKEFDELPIYDKKKNLIEFGNNLDQTGKARIIVHYGYSEDNDTHYTRVNAAIIDDVNNVSVHQTNGVTDEDFDF